LLDGFFPRCKVTDGPERRRVSGFREIGLPFESDTAVTRHLAAFLQVQGKGRDEPIRPTHVLFNGGVFKADALRHRLLDVLGEWFPTASPRLLEGEHDLDHAAARGAAYYGWSKHGGGVRIARHGRGYYVGIETAGLAVPGAPRPLRALCVVPSAWKKAPRPTCPATKSADRRRAGPIPLLQFLDAQTRSPGDVLSTGRRKRSPKPTPSKPRCPRRNAGRQLRAGPFPLRITELGVLELWCVSTINEKRWKLEFSVREDAEA